MEAEAEVGEVVSGRRRYWTAEEKRRIVKLTLSSSESVASLARRHGVNANQVFYWRKLYHAGQLGGDGPADAPGLRLLPVSVDCEELVRGRCTTEKSGTRVRARSRDSP